MLKAWFNILVLGVIGCLGSVVVLLIAGFIYWLLDSLAKGLGIAVAPNLNLIVRAFGVVGVVCGFIGLLIGFIVSRKDLGYVQRYIFLVLFGCAVPFMGSLIQYSLYKANPAQFSFDERVQNALGRSYSIAKHAEIADESKRLRALAETLRSIVSALAGKVSVKYLDPLSKWNYPAGCRRMELADLADRLCIERQIVYTRIGKTVGYTPMIRRADVAAGAPDYAIDSRLLTGPYHCPEQDVFGAGGLTMFKGETVSADNVASALVLPRQLGGSHFDPFQ